MVLRAAGLVARHSKRQLPPQDRLTGRGAHVLRERESLGVVGRCLVGLVEVEGAASHALCERAVLETARVAIEDVDQYQVRLSYAELVQEASDVGAAAAAPLRGVQAD